MLIDRIEARQNPTKHTLVALVENKPGVLNRVASLFRRRNFNIESLAVGMTDDPSVSRMTIVIDASKTNAALVERNLQKVVNVIDVYDLTSGLSVTVELSLIKVAVEDSQKRGEVKNLADMFGGRIVDVSPKSMILELTGDETKTDAALKVLADYGVLEVVRTGKVAMARG
jgi:acetolactate synthase-1/3 small subunit